VSTEEPAASTSETPKVAPVDKPLIAGDGPTQNARSWLKNILPTLSRFPSTSTQQRYSRPAAGCVNPLATTTSSDVEGE